MSLSKNVKTHYILIKEWERNQIRKIPITKVQYELYKEELEIKKHYDFFQIDDVETWKILFEWRASKIEWFEEINRDPTLIWKQWVCSFWSRHYVIWFPSNCNCSTKFKTIWVSFQDRLKEMWYKISHENDITDEMQREYIKRFLNK